LENDSLYDDLPSYNIFFYVSDSKTIYTRQVYDAFQMISDIGGFNGTIIMIFHFLVNSLFGINLMFEYHSAQLAFRIKEKSKLFKIDQRITDEDAQSALKSIIGFRRISVDRWILLHKMIPCKCFKRPTPNLLFESARNKVD
jgi:hypothetical protein